MTKKEQIIQWLKDHNVFEQFCNYSSTEEIICDRYLIQKTCVWSDTPEGHDFWSKIDDEYFDWYRKQFPDEKVYEKFL